MYWGWGGEVKFACILIGNVLGQGLQRLGEWWGLMLSYY